MKSIKAALKRKSQKDRQQLGDVNACCVLLGGGEGSSLASLTLLMAYQVIKEGLTSSTPPAFLAPHSAWEPVGTSQTQARLWANPPHPKVDDHTSDSHYFPHPINKAQFFFLSLYFPLPTIPSQNCQDLYALWEYLECEEILREKFPSFSQNWFFMCITSSQHANVSDVP